MKLIRFTISDLELRRVSDFVKVLCTQLFDIITILAIN
ncbi:hypothetical protein FRA_29c03880 [Francisella sp. W12-1067]|nr:hypothetical protein FRA_29c03880 [Francisella sp. W12-1067]